MTAIHQRVLIPENRQLHLEVVVPLDLPIGEAEITLTISPRRATQREEAVACLRELAARGGLRGGPDPAEWQREIRRDRPLPGRE